LGYFDSIYSADLPHRAVAVYMYLKGRANKDGICWPAVRTIARELHLSRATVQRALRELQASGWLVKENRYRDNGSSTSNLYRIK
jgi:DNA-binding transcriptional MocR family regulator